MKKNFAFIIGILITTSLFAQKGGKIEIPFTMDRNLIIIEVEVGKNQTHNFIFDTGTAGIMLVDSIAAQFKTCGFDSIVTPQGEFVTLQEKVLIPQLGFQSLKLKKQVANKFPKEMLFSPNVVGIIGMQTFVGYMITFDYQRGKLILEKGSLEGKPSVIPINLDYILEAKVKLNNQEVLAHFDCGGAGYISIPKSWSNLYTLKADPVFFTKGRTPMGDFDVFQAELAGDIQIGEYVISNPEINLVTGEFFFAINFGYQFFKTHLITIDTQNKLMQIVKI